MVAHCNIERFIDVVVDRYDLRAEDRFSHLFEVTFDLSLFDMFAAWQVGACMCVPTVQQRMLPAKYVVDSKLSVWFSVPSTALLMKETRTLTPNAFPGLRLSLFCGEALTMPVAEAWAEAAPRSVVENIYGPTELTLACTYYRFGPRAAEQSVNDVVPIGAPFPGMRAKVVDERLVEVPPGSSGELVMAGPQVALGYWDDPERTAAAFVTPPGETAVFYRTGDRVVRPVREDPLIFLGRLDSQIKIRGYRVELGEIEAAIRQEAGVDTAVVLGWPLAAAGGAEGVVAFIDDPGVDTAAMLRRVATRLPRYMVPREVRVVPSFPLNANGKVDRNALRALLGYGFCYLPGREMSLTRDALMEYLVGHAQVDPSAIEDTTELFSSGLVDSFAMVDLLQFLEKQTGARMGPEDISLDNLDSVQRILAFAASRERH
jgi:acyl-coenzyme A synthetase/AMP-(fatty) acid ligase/acyl carrier protein